MGCEGVRTSLATCMILLGRRRVNLPALLSGAHPLEAAEVDYTPGGCSHRHAVCLGRP